MQAIWPGQGKPHEQITGICGRDVAEAERFGVSRGRGSRPLGGNGCARTDRAPHDVWLRDGLAYQFVVLPVLAAGRRRRGLLPARRLGPMRDLSRPALGQAGLAQKPCRRGCNGCLATLALRSPSPFRACALRPVLILPSRVRGPVNRSHGFQFLISKACRARRSGVHPSQFGPTAAVARCAL
jgi:hypothetical protein